MSTLAVLLGHDIAYSASPAIHNAAFAACGLAARYELRDVAIDALRAEIVALRDETRLGANVTKPYKIAACELMNELAPEVERTGALNTVRRVGNRLIGHNTDLPALLEELSAVARQLGSSPRRAVILGAGGAARTAIAALEELGCTEVETVTRAGWASSPAAIRAADLLVNATPIGTGGEDSPIAADLLRPGLGVLDLVYRPSPTRLVREARARGAVARDGSGMLLRQAAASFELWTGLRAPIDAMRAALRSELGRLAGA